MNDMMFFLNSEFECNLPYFLVGVGCGKKQEFMKRDEDCRYIQWLQTRSGKGELLVNGIRKSVGKNQGMLLYLNVPHEYYAVDGEWVADWIIMGGKNIDILFKSMGADKCEVYNINNVMLLESKMKAILETACRQTKMISLDCSSLVYDFAISLFKCAVGDYAYNSTYNHSRLGPIFDYIEEYYYRTITLEELSNIIRLTPEYFCTVFKKSTGMKVSEYVNKIRITHSKEQLIKNRDKKISYIANQCGYEDVGYFNYIFKKYESVTPREFRKLYDI